MIGQMVNQMQQADPVSQPASGMISAGVGAIDAGAQAMATTPASTQQQYSITPPAPSSLVSPFSPQANQVGNAMYGDSLQKQLSLQQSTPLFKKKCSY
jgi:hypothetical protein